MALKSYTKKGYTYTESANGSNKFQNIKAAPTPMGERERPTVSAVRKQSASAKATSAAVATPVSTKAFSKGLADRQPMPKSSSGKPGESMMARAEAARPGGARQSTGPAPRPRVQATKKAPVSSAPTFPKGKGTPSAITPKKVSSYGGSFGAFLRGATSPIGGDYFAAGGDYVVKKALGIKTTYAKELAQEKEKTKAAQTERPGAEIAGRAATIAMLARLGLKLKR